MKKIKKSEAMVYVFFMIITFCKGIGLANSSKIYIVSYGFGVLLIIIKIFNDKFYKRELINLAIILGIGLMDFWIGGVTTVLFTAISLSCLKNIDINKIIKIMFWTRLIAFLLSIFLSITGVIDDNILLFYREADRKFIERHSFGYSHPNLAHSSFAIILILWGYIYFRKINLVKLIILEIINFALYTFTLSRTGFLIITLYLIFIWFAKNIKNFDKIILKFNQWNFIIPCIISFILAIGYGRVDFINKLNIVLTGRIRYMNLLLQNYHFPIIGKEHYANILFDNGYFDLLYTGGIFATIWFIVMQIKTNKILSKRKNVNEDVLLIFCLFYSIFESYYMSVLMNPSLLFFGYYIFENNKKTNSIKDEFVEKIE